MKKRVLLAFMVVVVALLLVPAVALADAPIAEQHDEIAWKTGPYPYWYTWVGDVYTQLWADGTMRVMYVARAGFAFAETHVAVGEYADPSNPNAESIVGIPVTRKGSPVPGQFPFGDEWYQYAPDYVKVKTYIFNVHDLGLSSPPYVVLAHCVAVDLATGQMETGWATGCRDHYWDFPGANWARFFDIPYTHTLEQWPG